MNKTSIISYALFAIPFFSYAAFNEIEVNQLKSINGSSNSAAKISIEKKEKAVKFAVENNPEKKNEIVNTDKAWVALIENKCIFETMESKGTDALPSLMDECYAKEYNDEALYFERLLP
ncbi:hypothetical protein [Rahnella contaminans]|uniref:hypothetical protein n=1 Tax=Rahnella contaminans TaxID=2703882 RepID=UPI0023D9D5FE|nr:hypothetical protein [Rahnella contaminans]MDF1897172.1 hypothetical protein [Rahnella contaminans]